jgi:Mn2+/Fe2+ NRAMP family transporter
MIGGVVQAFVGSVTSDPGAKTTTQKEMMTQAVATILAFLIALAILAFVGQYLWNNSVVELISIAKPARSVWPILGLFIFGAIMKP